ncbi:type II toxin-antitoxin system ParD family antitoxin [Paracoccus sp. J55]|nr:type II toxin-antitoxin system ParD family antitoxin [Paracoccus sp. J55]
MFSRPQVMPKKNRSDEIRTLNVAAEIRARQGDEAARRISGLDAGTPVAISRGVRPAEGLTFLRRLARAHGRGDAGAGRRRTVETMLESDMIEHEGDVAMPNVHLTEPMRDYVEGQIRSGAYANLSEVVRAGIRLLMEKDGARQFYALKAELEEAAAAAEAGGFAEFDARAFEPDAFRG